METVKVNDLISFYTCSNSDRVLYKGIVEYKNQLGLITFVDGIQYELKRLIDIKII